MNKQKRNLLIAVGITSILLIAFMGVVIKMITENGQCVDSPFQYSAEKLKESGGNYMCGCQSLDPELLDFTFNEEGINIIKPNDNQYIDVSSLNLIEGNGGYLE